VIQFGLAETASIQFPHLYPIKGHCVPLAESLYPLLLAQAVVTHALRKYEYMMDELPLLNDFT
jgi:hypothetical protein